MKNKFIAIIGVVVALVFSNGAAASKEIKIKQCSKFSESQIEVMRNAWFAGADRGYGWTLAAIAWKESSAGNNLVNWRGPAFGVFHNLLKTVAKRNGVTSERDQLRLADRLVEDFDFAAESAMDELDYWKKVHTGNWERIVASYYAGYNWKYSGGQAYKDDVVKKIRFLRNNGCLFNEL